jgi:fructosamine-3-kinase
MPLKFAGVIKLNMEARFSLEILQVLVDSVQECHRSRSWDEVHVQSKISWRFCRCLWIQCKNVIEVEEMKQLMEA